MSKRILVCGAGGFIGSKLVTSLKEQGHYVIGADVTTPRYETTGADKFFCYDLTNAVLVDELVSMEIDEIYQLAADMGGAGYIFTGENDANIMSNSAAININILNSMVAHNVTDVFYSSSACAYPEFNQVDPESPLCAEYSVYPAMPDSEYGWEKLFSERLYASYSRNYNLRVRIARLHNVFGPCGSWDNGKEKAPAALCRKVAEASPENNNVVEVWGPGNQTRSFLYIDEAIKGIHHIMASDYNKPVNLGSSTMIAMNDLALLIASIANKEISIRNIPGPVGVMGRTSDNALIEKVTNWTPDEDLESGLRKTYTWINGQLG